MTTVTRGSGVAYMSVSGRIHLHPVTKSEACLGIRWVGGESVVLVGPATGFLNNDRGRRGEQVGVGGGDSQHGGRAREVDGRTGKWGGRELKRGDRQLCKLSLNR